MPFSSMFELIGLALDQHPEGVNRRLAKEAVRMSSNSNEIISMMLLGNEIDRKLLMKCCAEINAAVTAVQTIYADTSPASGRPASM